MATLPHRQGQGYNVERLLRPIVSKMLVPIPVQADPPRVDEAVRVASHFFTPVIAA